MSQPHGEDLRAVDPRDGSPREAVLGRGREEEERSQRSKTGDASKTRSVRIKSTLFDRDAGTHRDNEKVDHRSHGDRSAGWSSSIGVDVGRDEDGTEGKKARTEMSSSRGL